MKLLLIPVLFAFSVQAEVVYDFNGVLLWGGQGSSIMTFQQKVSEKLRDCGKNPIGSDGAYGRGTHRGLQTLLRCPGFTDFDSGVVTFALWDRLFDGQVFYPTVLEQAVTLTMSQMDGDFDDIEYRNGGLYWGPFKARIGSRINQVGEILNLIFERHPEWAEDMFASDLGFIKRFSNLKGRSAREMLSDSRRRGRIISTLVRMSRDSRGRQAYIDYVFVTKRWFRNNIDRLIEVIGEDQLTEIDYAFALDVSWEIEITESIKETLATSLAQLESRLGRQATPAEKRQHIANQLIDDSTSDQRIARNLVYFVDQDGIRVDNQHYQLWLKHSKLKAAHLGLRDIFFEPYLSR